MNKLNANKCVVCQCFCSSLIMKLRYVPPCQCVLDCCCVWSPPMCDVDVCTYVVMTQCQQLLVHVVLQAGSIPNQTTNCFTPEQSTCLSAVGLMASMPPPLRSSHVSSWKCAIGEQFFFKRRTYCLSEWTGCCWLVIVDWLLLTGYCWLVISFVFLTDAKLTSGYTFTFTFTYTLLSRCSRCVVK